MSGFSRQRNTELKTPSFYSTEILVDTEPSSDVRVHRSFHDLPPSDDTTLTFDYESRFTTEVSSTPAETWVCWCSRPGPPFRGLRRVERRRRGSGVEPVGLCLETFSIYRRSVLEFPRDTSSHTVVVAVSTIDVS